MPIDARLSSAPMNMTVSTPKGLMSLPVTNEGANMPTTCEEMTRAASANGWPQTPIEIGVEVMRKFMTP